MAGPSCAGSIPRIDSSPPLVGETAAIIRIVEDLPAPLGPRKPNASPRWTSMSMPLTASTTPPDRDSKDLRSPRARIIASLGSTTRPTLQRGTDKGTLRFDPAQPSRAAVRPRSVSVQPTQEHVVSFDD